MSALTGAGEAGVVSFAFKLVQALAAKDLQDEIEKTQLCFANLDRKQQAVYRHRLLVAVAPSPGAWASAAEQVLKGPGMWRVVKGQPLKPVSSGKTVGVFICGQPPTQSLLTVATGCHHGAKRPVGPRAVVQAAAGAVWGRSLRAAGRPGRKAAVASPDLRGFAAAVNVAANETLPSFFRTWRSIRSLCHCTK